MGDKVLFCAEAARGFIPQLVNFESKSRTARDDLDEVPSTDLKPTGHLREK